MREYELLGHMRKISGSCETDFAPLYIPHHPVLRESSTTTRLRVVFNASSRTSNGSSLNDHLMAGPKLQTELPAIILAWRQFRFVYTADITKMYRQIRMDPRDTPYQRILWSRAPSEPPSEFELLTVTYGTACAPFQALRVLQQLIQDEGEAYPEASVILRDHCYVDDILFGDSELDGARRKRSQLIQLLKKGGFELRKWASNAAELLTEIDPAEHGLACHRSLDKDESVKVLGLSWSPASDNFRVQLNLPLVCPQSKREILSTIARLFDPLGWLTPATIAAKIIMQRLWASQVGWDDELPTAIANEWGAVFARIAALTEVRIPRWIGCGPEVRRRELHGFADASSVAYAAVVYLRVTSPSGVVTVSLIAGRSRVAPLKTMSIPRLELSAAVLLARLLSFICESGASDPPDSCCCWSDSTVVKAWLAKPPATWITFVANRVAEISSLLPGIPWRHVPTADNPADCASRGLRGDELVGHDLWWRGPAWLAQPESQWPPNICPNSEDKAVEERAVVTLLVCRPPAWDFAERLSSWPRLIRVTAYVLRFFNRARVAIRAARDFGPGLALCAAECRAARVFWLRRIQAELFPAEVSALSDKRLISANSSLSALNPVIDEDGLIRVGGRLRNAPLPVTSKHPIILAAHLVVTLIVRQAHVRALHGGTQLTLSTLRQEFWLLHGRTAVRAAIHKCIVCTREAAAIPRQLMGDLPTLRVSPPSRCFEHCGLDYAGPVLVRASGGRGIASRKAYLALFICLATRAIHLELVSDYTTNAFVGAFSRFCARRGMPKSVYSDNGTTFVGANRALTSAYRAALRDPAFLGATASDGVQWKFLPPSAPHFGGLWEAGVRSVKHHLRRVLKNDTLTFEEFTTLLCRIEACLNSRPLAPLTDAPDDNTPLTPGHFLVGDALTAPPEPSLLQLNENRLSRWQRVRRITERFWRLWQSDYVNTLQQRSKWRTRQPPMRIGQIVLIKQSNKPPCQWELGRVIETHPGSDGLVRVVTVRTAKSVYKRPIVKLCVLPVDLEAAAE